MKQVTHIDCPKEWVSDNDWDSHRELLWLACEKTKDIDGIRIEIGCGHGSTNLLEKYYEDKNTMDGSTLCGKAFVSFDTNKEWADKFPKTIFLNNYEYALLISDGSVFTFVDCAPAELRKSIVDSISNKSKIIIIHDTEKGADYVYKLSDILAHNFKYRIDYCPEGKPWTTAVSNFIDIEKWVG